MCTIRLHHQNWTLHFQSPAAHTVDTVERAEIVVIAAGRVETTRGEHRKSMERMMNRIGARQQDVLKIMLQRMTGPQEEDLLRREW